jgi:hypothetical protein
MKSNYIQVHYHHHQAFGICQRNASLAQGQATWFPTREDQHTEQMPGSFLLLPRIKCFKIDFNCK